MRKTLYIILISSIVVFLSCESNKEAIYEKEGELLNDRNEQNSLVFDDEVEFAQFCLQRMSDFDFSWLKEYSDKEKGILFSPYAYIDENTAPFYSYKELMEDLDRSNFWGFQDGSGDSLNMTPRDFIQKYIISPDFLNEDIKISVLQGKPNAYGSELHNVQDIFPKDKYVEFYKAASENIGMDWKALILVIGKKDDKFILKAILHNQWTV